MSKKTEKATPEAMTQVPEEVTETVAPVEVPVKIAPCVYCGPSVRGVARQYTVYAGSIPETLKAFITAHPAAKGLLVSVDRFAQVRSDLGRSGTAEAILFQKIKSEL